MISLIVLIALPFLIWIAWKNVRLARESAAWPGVPGTVTVSEKTGRAWRVAYTYIVEGQDYTGTNVYAGAKPGGKVAYSILSRYPVGTAVTVHYSPRNPAMAALEPGPNQYASALLRMYWLWFFILLGVNVALFAVNRWTASNKEGETPARTYDDVAASDPGLGDRLIQEGADKGDAKDEGYAGAWYLGGLEGYAKDPAKAAEWFRKSAEQGDAGSQTLLGDLYAKGAGVPKDLPQAVSWFEKAAAQNDPHACVAMGMASEKGVANIPKDRQKAIEWYKKAGNDPMAAKALARLGAN